MPKIIDWKKCARADKRGARAEEKKKERTKKYIYDLL